MVLESLVALTAALSANNEPAPLTNEVEKVSLEKVAESTQTTSVERDQRRSRTNLRRAKCAVQHQANLQVAMSPSSTPKRAGTSANTTCVTDSTLVTKALSTDDVELMDVLVKYGNNPEGVPALHYAILKGDERAVELLLAHGASSFTKDSQEPYIQGRNCLYFAVKSGNLTLVDLFLDLGVDINQRSYGGLQLGVVSPLNLAIAEGKNDVAKHLVARGASLEPWGYPDRSPNCLYFSCAYGNLEMLTFLLTNGAYVIDQQPLIDALFSRHYSNTNSESLGTEKIKCLEYLLEKHLILLPINPNQYGIENMSPEALEYLINNMYLSPNHTDSLGRPLLYNAMSCLDLLEGLLKHGVNLNAVTAQDGCHNTPIFHYVARNCCYTSISWDTAFIKERQDILSFFIRNGVDVSSKDDIGMTAFHKIAKYDTASLSSENRGQLKNVLGSLIEAGLDLNARDRDGKTALTYVQDEPLKKWLMSFGATE